MVVSQIVQMDQMKIIAKITHVLWVMSNAEMENNVSQVKGDVMVMLNVPMDQTKKIVL